MRPSIAVIAPGMMGAAIGKRLAGQGAIVLTTLAGRSEASGQRATAAGMVAVGEAEIAAADFFLSIVPPRAALPLAQSLAPALQRSNRKPVYVDCNAVSPETARRIADVIAAAGCPFVDAGIIGGPPRAGYNGPSIYVSGANEARVELLNDYGLFIKRMDGNVGDASALKMSYGGLTKGLTALGSALILAATREQVAEALHRELAASQPALLSYLTRSIPDMFPKAYRWVGEMEEVADFVGEGAEQQIYAAIAGLYARLAADFSGARQDIDSLARFFSHPPAGKGS
jgi:3-hydroxyisobutyrate dehydrogenase-like beta-hydroxyacid dehydrogenase